MRIIPKKTKIGIEIFKGIGLVDLLIGLVFATFAVLAITSNMPGKLYVTALLVLVGVIMLVKVDDEPNYTYFLSILRHLVYRKSYRKDAAGKSDIQNLSSFKRIEDGFIVYDGYYGAALEIPPIEFRFFSAYRKTISIDECLGNVLRSLNQSYAANIVKIERRVPYDSYIANEKKKLDELRESYECGLISEEEFQAKCEVVFDRVGDLEEMNSTNCTVAPYYYLVLFEGDKNRLSIQLDTAMGTLQRGEMNPKRLNSKELALFLKYTNELDFDESELDTLSESEYASWAMPDSVDIKSKEYLINDMTAYTMAISNYPLRVGDAWLARVMSMPATKVVVKLQPMDKLKTVKNIDRSISELRGRYSHTDVDSNLIEIRDHIKSLSELLSMLQSDNEVLLNTNVYVICYDVPLTIKNGHDQKAAVTNRRSITNMRSTVRRVYREEDLRLSGLQFRQMEGYIGSQISGYDPLAKTLGRGIPGSTAAAMLPWIFAHVQDPNGVKLGSEDGIPVFIDMFRRDSERVNSNVVIVGKTGSGKSYAAKSILVNLAADNSKIFVLDPENEYSELAANLHGKFINVGNAQQGRMNPFHIITALEDDVAEGVVTGSYASHMQFLEEFFKQILPDCDKEALEYLNTLVDRVYVHKGITAQTNLSLLKPEDYPTFSDVYDEILTEFQCTDNDYLRTILRTLVNQVSKFSSGGRNANIWDGPSTVTTEENFTVFNFQSLLAGGNKTVTNAQMLLVMKYIDNEIIKNREYNIKYGTNRKIVVVIDEAHVFIDDKYPIALDFMYQMAKRIRKYNGMQIVITQNIKDFVGSEEISRKSSAIINACQYSYIFSLAPNDMSDLCKLYEKAGGINENEQDKIVTAPRGNAFVVLGPTSRSSFQVEVPEDVAQIFEQRNRESHYFSGSNGEREWGIFLGESREKYLANRKSKEIPLSVSKTERPSSVELVEISEDEYEREVKILKQKDKAKTTVSRDIPAQKPVAENVQENKTEEIPVTRTSQVNTVTEEKTEMAQMLAEFRHLVEALGTLSHDAIVNDVVSRLSGVTAMPQIQPGIPLGEVSPVSEFAELNQDMVRFDEISFDDTYSDNFDVGALLEELDGKTEESDAEQTYSYEQTEDYAPALYLDKLFGDDAENEEETESEDSEELSWLEFSDELVDTTDISTDEDTDVSGPDEDNLFDSIFSADAEEDDTEDSDDEDSDDAAVSLMEYLQQLAKDEELTSDIGTNESGDDDSTAPFASNEGGRLDIMSFIEKAAAEIDNVTVLEDMADSGEEKRTITLADLIKLNKNRKN